MTAESPEFVLYAQHGWADDHRAIASLAYSITDSKTLVVAPSLGFLKTWLRIEPLIEAVEDTVRQTALRYPALPIRIIGHSMGGLIWLELLNRHPEWWSQVESLVLVASPIGGADLGRILDPLGLGIGIARDLGLSRRGLAEAVAAQIPTLVIAGDVDGGSDGTIPVESTKVFGAEFICLPNVSHAAMRNHPLVGSAIQQFWALPKSQTPPVEPDLPQVLIRRLQAVPGMTDTHPRDFTRASVFLRFDNGIHIRTWKHPAGIDHVFVASPQGECLYSGFVGWLHLKELRQTLEELQQEHAALLLP